MLGSGILSMIMNKKLILLLTSAFIIKLTWSLIILPFEFPDEQAHLATTQFLSNENRMPDGKENDLSRELYNTEKYLGTFRDNNGNNSYTYHSQYHPTYSDKVVGINEKEIMDLNSSDNKTNYVWVEAAKYPPLYYIYTSIFYKLSSHSSILDSIYFIRIGTDILSVLLVYIAYLIGLEIFDKKSNKALTLAILVSLQPMLTFVGSGINSDNLFNLLFTLFIYFCLKIINYGCSNKYSFVIGLVIGLAFLTKTQAYLMLPILLISLALLYIKTNSLKGLISFLVRVGTTIFIIAGWKEIPKIYSLLIYGVIPGAELITSKSINPPSFYEFLKFSINKLYSQNLVWYWGVFKWLGIVLPSIYWQIANRIIIISGIGILIYYLKNIRDKTLSFTINITLLVISTIIYVVGIFYYDYSFAHVVGYSLGIQARYYFPTIVPQLALLLLGLTSFTTNKKLQRIIAISLGTYFIILQIAGIYTILNSYYDLSSMSQLIIKISQYKPIYAKGYYWYLWGILYIYSLILNAKLLFSFRNETN